MSLPERFRAEFPVLEGAVYLNSNSTGAFPRGMEDVLDDYAADLRNWRDEVWDRWWPALQRYHASLERFLGAAPGTIVTDGSVATLLGRLATCFTFEGERRRIVTTDLEFPTVPFLWKGFRRYGAEPVVVGTGDDPEGAIERVLDERVKLVCITHGAYRTGRVLDVARIARAAHRVGALVAVDAYQTVGTLPIDVQALDVDFLLGGAHKWCCGAEIAFLYVRPELVGELCPAATGWMAGANPFSFGPVEGYAPDARRFASGTPAVLPAMLSQVGLQILSVAGVEAIHRHSLSLTNRILDWAEAHRIATPTPSDPDKRGGIVVLRFPGDERVARELVRRNFICSWRGGLRLGPHFYNSAEEVDRFLEEILAVRREVA